MTTSTTKLSVLAFLGLGLVAYGQYDGKVGINTKQPGATLEIKPSTDNALETAKTNEGIMAPQLSKKRVANIEAPVEGTLVYVKGTAYTPGANTTADARVVDITENGYYYYNGTKWVKSAAGTGVSSNLYTANGTLTGERTVTMGGNTLKFTGGQTIIEQDSFYPLIVNSTNEYGIGGGGIAIHPNDFTKRVELSTTGAGDFRVYAGDDDRMIVKASTGYMGIGTDTPVARLDVGSVGNNNRSSVLSTSEETAFKISALQGTTGANALVGALGMEYFLGPDNAVNTKNSYIKFYRGLSYDGGFMTFTTNNDTERMRITADGKVGVGTTAPATKLHVEGDARITNLPTGAADDQVVVADANGNLKKLPMSSVGTSYTAGTGIQITGTTISTKSPLRTETAGTTLAATDNGGYVYINSSTAVTVTVPASLPAGFSCVVVQKGTGQVSFVGETGVTLESAKGVKTRARYSAVGIVKDTTATATITGDAIN